jgi:superfamily II DNA or RNA helicase
MTRISYQIDREASLKDDAFVIRVDGGQLGPEDREIISQLQRDEIRYQTKKTGRKPTDKEISTKRFHLSTATVQEVLKPLAATGRLYFGEKAIVCDFYSKNPLSFHVEGDRITGLIHTRNDLIDLSECPFIGRADRHCFLQGITLKFLSVDIPWNTLKKTYTQDPSPTLEEIKECVIAGDPETPQLEISGPLHQATPLPILKLKNPTGAFADLWMDYGDTQAPYSQKEEEVVWEKDLLETSFSKKQMDNSHYFCPLDKVRDTLAFLLELGWTVIDREGRSVMLGGELTLESEIIHDHVFIKGSIPFGECSASLKSLAHAYAGQAPFVTLSANTVGLLPNHTQIQSLIHEGELVDEGIQIKVSQTASLEPILTKCGTLDASLKDLLDEFKKPASVSPSKAFTGTLRPYQQSGLDWLGFLQKQGFHGILADDMGLGKTVQVLAFLSTLNSSCPSLIVVPTSLLHNWKQEGTRFIPDTPFILHYGPDRAKEADELPKSGIILTSYGTLLRDADMLKTVRWKCLFLDEAQTIKNRRTQLFQTVCQLKADFRVSITGTPVENRIEELFSQFHFLMPDLLDSCDPEDVGRIKKRTRPFILRRTKEQVAKELPEKIEQNLWVAMSEEQRLAYDRFLSGARSNLLKKVKLDGTGKHRMEILETLLRLRQICCHPLLVHAEEPARSGKLDALINDLETIQEEGKKALVFSQFTSMLNLISRKCSEKRWDFCHLDGNTKNREEQVERFQNDPTVSFFLISLKAGGVGLNLTAADYVLLYDPWWNPAVEQQAIDRAHRIGRQDTVIAKRYLCLDSIEEKMLHLNTQKKQLAESLFDETSPNFSLTEEDFLYLLD